MLTSKIWCWRKPIKWTHSENSEIILHTFRSSSHEWVREQGKSFCHAKFCYEVEGQGGEIHWLRRGCSLRWSRGNSIQCFVTTEHSHTEWYFTPAFNFDSDGHIPNLHFPFSINCSNLPNMTRHAGRLFISGSRFDTDSIRLPYSSRRRQIKMSVRRIQHDE